MTLTDRTDAYCLWLLRDGLWWLIGWGKESKARDVASQRYGGEIVRITKGINGAGEVFAAKDTSAA